MDRESTTSLSDNDTSGSTKCYRQVQRGPAEQSGGNILKAVGKIGSTISKSSGSITKGLSKAGSYAEKGMAKVEQAQSLLESGLDTAEQLTSRAEALADRGTSIATEIGDIYKQYGPREPDLNYSDPSLSSSAPLSPNSGQNFQSFGDSICINKAFIRDLRTLFNELFAKRNDI